MEMEILDRKAAAKLLGMTANALSCHIYRKNWGGVPKPIVIGNRYRWAKSQILEFLEEKLEEAKTGAVSQPVRKKQGKGGRPRKTKSASC